MCEEVFELNQSTFKVWRIETLRGYILIDRSDSCASFHEKIYSFSNYLEDYRSASALPLTMECERSRFRWNADTAERRSGMFSV